MMTYRQIYVQQLDETDCGAAALAMILKYYKSNISISLIRRLAQTDKNGTTALGLIKTAEHFGLETQAFRADINSLKRKQESLSCPFIAHLNKEHGLLHFVVVLRLSSDKVTIADPDPKIKIRTITLNEFNKIWTGILILFSPGQKYTRQINKSSSLVDTAKILLKQKTIILEIVLFMMVSTTITIAGAFFLQQIIDNIVPKKSLQLLQIMVLGLTVAYVFHGLFNFIEGAWSIILSQRLTKEILSKYISHLLKLPVSFFEARRAGEITSRFQDANSIIEALASTAVTTILNFGTIIIVGGVLIVIDIKLFIIALISIPTYGTIIFSFIHLFNKLNHERMEQNAVLSSEIIENLNGIESIKSLSAETTIFVAFEFKFKKLLKANYSYNIVNVVQESFKDVAELILNLFILYVGAILAIRGIVSVGELIAFSALLSYFLGPLQQIINLQNQIQTANVANQRLNQVLNEPSEDIGKRVDSLFDHNGHYALQIKKLSFEYRYGQPVIKHLNLNVAKNESIAIVGLTGSGKSTLAKLLVNFYKFSDGSIKINGHDIKEFNNASLRSYVEYIPQKSFIFTGSVRDNITLGNQKATDQDIVNAAKIAEIHDEILVLPSGYDTNISSENGLSGGQMQRIAIARAIVVGAPIMIFDESTSNLDPLTEKKYYTI